MYTWWVTWSHESQCRIVWLAKTSHTIGFAVRLLHVVLSADLLSESVSAGKALPGPQDSVLWCGTVPFLCHDWSWQHRVPPCRILLQGNSRVFYVTELFLKIGSVNRVCREWLQQITNVFTTKCELNLKPCSTQSVMSASCVHSPPIGEKLLPELQRILHPHHAAVHEAGLRQDAHRLQWVPIFPS